MTWRTGWPPINCVRLHFMDTWYKNFMDERKQGILADDAETQRKLSPEQLDKLDYLIAALKKHGIYVNMNLHVGRTLDERDGLPGGGKLVGHGLAAADAAKAQAGFLDALGRLIDGEAGEGGRLHVHARRFFLAQDGLHAQIRQNIRHHAAHDRGRHLAAAPARRSADRPPARRR